MIHSFLMIGQSNMAGRGFPEEVEPIRSPRLFVLRNGRWQPMYTPVNCDRPFSGVSLAESFALRYSERTGAETGLIPCAEGRSSISEWEPGSLLFDHAVMQARLAARTSSLRGILWHQGEADCAPDRWPFYEERLREMLRAFRAALGEAPVVIGGLGDYLAGNTGDPALANYQKVNAALRAVAESEPQAVFVPADGLTANPDALHFNAKSLRAFGERYEEAFARLTARG